MGVEVLSNDYKVYSRSGLTSQVALYKQIYFDRYRLGRIIHAYIQTMSCIHTYILTYIHTYIHSMYVCMYVLHTYIHTLDTYIHNYPLPTI